MATLGYSTAILPSRGYLYGGKLPDGKVEFRRLTVEEDILIQSTLSGTELISALLGACCKFPAGFTQAELLSTDRMALLLAIRVLTFGPKYGYTYRCQTCDVPLREECNLATDLQSKAAEESLCEPMSLTLQGCDRKVSVRFLRGSDEDALFKASKDPKANGLAISLVTQLAMQIVEVDGNVIDSLEDREKFIRALPIPDAEDIRDMLSDKEPGVDLRLYPVCSKCGASNVVALPLDLSFFRPARRRA